MSEEIFTQNLVAFRKYAVSQGAYFNENGYLVYNGKILTRSDTEYLNQSSLPFERLLTSEEIKALFDNLVDYVFEYEVNQNE